MRRGDMGVECVFITGDAGMTGGLPTEGGGAEDFLVGIAEDQREETERDTDDDQEIGERHGWGNP